ncbi:probable Mitochondrial escape protein 2 [Saccharomycodes ludwigii]|uniref:Mitochondrial escape protein 2 n=1 Tax=Saccharomycodes ludwigii TaxID=36035 RepID=A0A376B7Y8_9ASCO|nr:hypothetical protein SCDLUD_004414 [Saccharomycodes ludwigii]KAH3898993.1 hypothetical protein SCDLUD_004414 [Saccharomycodes ludwigii]SSD60240.1 probable Mitochondrial escape protein 2 [Saccharomycodes ludwigii]
MLAIKNNISLTRIIVKNRSARLLLSTQKRFNSDNVSTTQNDIQKKDEEVGESNKTENTGVIHKSKRETLIYFDNIYQRAGSIFNLLQWYDFISLRSTTKSTSQRIMKYANNPANPIHGLELNSLVPMRKDGGCFAKFYIPPNYTLSEVNAKIQSNTELASKGNLLSFITKVTAFPVKGTPWIEDLKRLPKKIIHVKFEGEHIFTEEELYALFRRYGQIVEIIAGGTQQATIIFKSLKGATCAKNCINGLFVNGTTLHIQFDKKGSSTYVRDFFVNHTRIAVPLLFAFISILAVLIFDPIREFMIEQKITHKYSLSKDNYWIKYLARWTNKTMSSFRNFLGSYNSKQQSDVTSLWEERVEQANDLKMWLEENNNTFVIVRGPRGSGKHELVMRYTLKDRNNVLYLDCENLVKTRIDSKFLKNAASQLGYYPIFPWINSIASIVDLGVQGLTGQKSGLSESKEKQFNTMLGTSLMAIRRIALQKYKPTITLEDGTVVSIKEEDYLQQHPEEKPVIVIDRFSNKSEINNFVYKELADWAALLVQMNMAHVVFLTETVSPNQLLSESLPNQVFKNLVLSDASKENSEKYVLERLDEKYQNEKLRKGVETSLAPLGGRMLDLQGFVRRVKSGESPEEALNKMIIQSTEQITQMFLNDKANPLRAAQAWELIELLSENYYVDFDKIVFKPLFKAAPEEALLDLEKQGLITVSRDRGILDKIMPAKPLFKSSFQNLVKDAKVSTVLKTGYYLRVIAFETGRIRKWEEELRLLGKVSDQKMFKSRLEYLSNKIDLSDKVIDNSENEIKKLSQSV